MRIREVNACWLLPLKPFNQAINLLQPPDFVFTRDPNIVTTGDPWLPKPVGHLLEKSTGERHLVHSHRGPACGPRHRGHPLKIPGGTLVEDGSGDVRPLLPEELWEMQGGKARFGTTRLHQVVPTLCKLWYGNPAGRQLSACSKRHTAGREHEQGSMTLIRCKPMSNSRCG